MGGNKYNVPSTHLVKESIPQTVTRTEWHSSELVSLS